MMASQSQGEIGIERMCQLAGISRSGYYRHWQLSAPRREETGLRDAIQRLALKHRHYGYRRIGALLRREGWQANHKRVLRLMREDNLLCLRHTPFVPTTTNSRHSWCVVPNLIRGIVLNGLDQLWVAPTGCTPQQFAHRGSERRSSGSRSSRSNGVRIGFAFRWGASRTRARVYDSSKRSYAETLTRARGLDGIRALMRVLRRSTGGADFAHKRHHNDREREAGANSKVGIGKCQHQRLTIGQQP
jgi:hypothetical protein